MKNKNQLLVVSGQWLIVVLLTTCMSSCDKKKPGENVKIDTKPVVQAPAFNQDTAYFYVNKQVAFGPRVPNTIAHLKCGDYFIETFKKNGCHVMVQAFSVQTHDNKNYRLRNIIASVNPQVSKRILISAHWDTREKADQDANDKAKPLDGANDGGSGVAILLEIARAINQSPVKPLVGIDLVLWDGEDNGSYSINDSWCLGSQYWSKQKHIPGYSAFFGINLDMVGAKDAKFAMEGASVKYANDVLKKVWSVAGSIGYSNHFVAEQVDDIVDDHVYVNTIAKIPTIDIIEYDPLNGGFNETWHTQQDNLSNIDRTTLKAVGQTLLQVLYNE